MAPKHYSLSETFFLEEIPGGFLWSQALLGKLVVACHFRKLLQKRHLEAGNLAWLGGRDSNPDSAVQSRMSYH